jgi:hypothetical protein
MPSTNLLAAVYQYSCRKLQGGQGSSHRRDGQVYLGEAHEGQGGDERIIAEAVATNPVDLQGVASMERRHKAFQLVDKIVQGVGFD